MKKLLFIVALLVLVLLVSVSCGKGKSPSGTGATSSTTTSQNNENEPIHVFMTANKAECAIVYPLDVNGVKEIQDAIDYLGALIEENASGAFEMNSDYVMEGEEIPDTKEVLLGLTNRPESGAVARTLRTDDYVICIENGKLVIAGGSDAATAKAIKRFADLFFSKTQNALILKESFRYEKNGEYPVTSLTLSGTKINEYTIVSAKGFEADALFLQNELARVTGYILPITDGKDAAHKIEFAASSKAGAFAALTEAGLKLSGDTVTNRNVAVARFVAALEDKGGDVALDQTFAIKETVEKGSEITLFDLNVYSSGYGENSVNSRYPRLMSLVAKYKPTILTLQDVSTYWLTNMKDGIGTTPALLDSYDYVGTGRNNDDESVMQPILFDKSLYTLKDSGTFWLSETPEWESVGWDGRSRCVCTWAILTDKASGKDFVVMNTALDFHGSKARIEGLKLIMERAEAFGLPVILAGDMQNIATSNSTKVPLEYAFVNSQAVAGTLGEVGKTVNGKFGSNFPRLSDASDFVFASYGDFVVNSYGVIKDLVEDQYVSNHWAVLTKLCLAK